MSEPSPGLYKLDQSEEVKIQVRAIAAFAKKVGKSRTLGNLMRKAMHLLQNDPLGWGDPEYRAKTVNAIICRGIVRPLVFKYAVYEQVRTVVLLSVTQFADFT